MEWNRGVRPNQPAGQPAAHPVGAPSPAPKAGKSGNNVTKFAGLGLIALLVLGLLVLGLSSLKGGLKTGEASAINSKQMQAVFLNGGQVYFGKISDLNSQYLRLNDIYYLRVNQQVQPNQTTADATQSAANDISLVKLGCELHGPEDKMTINREQVIFWENLKDDGQVAKAVAEYIKQNPEGQKCDAAGGQSTSTGTNTGATTPATTGTSTGTTGTPATPTTPTRPATGTTTTR